MAAISFWFLSIIPYLTVLALAQSSSHFINPPEAKIPTQDSRINSIYRVGDIVNIAWSTPEPVVTLIINQANSSLTEIDYLPNSVALTQQSYSWKVTIDGSDGGSKFDLALANQFNFELFKANGTAALAASAFFNITDATVDEYGRIIPTTGIPTVLPSTTSTASSSSTTSTAALLPLSASPTTKAVLTKPTSSSSTKVILGAVLGVGGFVLVVAATVVYFFLRQRANTNGQFARNDPAPKYSSRQYNELQDLPSGDWKAASELHSSTKSTLHAAELPS